MSPAQRPTLVVGNRNYSSWSLRAYLALAQTPWEFDVHVIPLDRAETRQALAEHSPSGLVPVWRDGETLLWESLAIAEYAAERCPQAGLWPEDAAVRAHARAMSCEMHAGFAALRRHMPMDMRASHPVATPREDVQRDIARILTLWRECRQRFGSGGRFLFGARFGIADAMFAPVVSRFRTYDVRLDDASQAYCDAVWAHEPMRTWTVAARAEPWEIHY